MKSAELSGLVLTHSDRTPALPIRQLSDICDQVVVVNDSRDGDFDRSLLEGVRDACEVNVLERPFDTFPGQRNAGIEKALGAWVLSVDSDETLSPELLHEVAELEPPKSIAVYEIPRTETLRGRQLRVSHAYGAFHPRLFRSDLRYAAHPVVHEQFSGLTTDRTGRLAGKINHIPPETVRQLIAKAVEYGKEQGADSSDDMEFNLAKIALTIPNFLARRGFWRDGVDGFIMASMQMAYRIGTKTGRSAGSC